LPGRNFFRYLTRNGREFFLVDGPMDDDNPISIHAEIATPWIDYVQTIPLLFSDVGYPKLFGVQEFDNPAF
jgi:hypothetical protein